MASPETLLLLAGFTFAHAVWNLSDLQNGELLVPLAITEKQGKRELTRFEADTQAEAISKGKAELARIEGKVDAWAFAREGQFKENGKYFDVLTVEAKATGMKEPIVFVQRFQPYSSGAFKLLGQPMVLVGSNMVEGPEEKKLLAQLTSGIQKHKQAASLWSAWVQK